MGRGARPQRPARHHDLPHHAVPRGSRELADRVGIIADGLLSAEGTPAELKRQIGTDLIVAEVEGDTEAAARALRAIDGVGEVQVHDQELSLATPEGSRHIAQVAVALDGCGLTVRSLTLRTPTLDDVFLDVTGAHFGHAEATTNAGTSEPS